MLRLLWDKDENDEPGRTALTNGEAGLGQRLVVVAHMARPEELTVREQALMMGVVEDVIGAGMGVVTVDCKVV